MLSARSIRRASTSRCSAVCGGGRYSSLDTTWVGTGEGKEASSAGNRFRLSSSLRKCIETSVLPKRLSKLLAGQMRKPDSRNQTVSERLPCPTMVFDHEKRRPSV